MKVRELQNKLSNFKTTSTSLEERVCEIICSKQFPFSKFLTISELLIRRQSRRRERIRTDFMNKTDYLNKFKRSDFPRITQFQ